jgi:hypothetical protein
MSYTLFCHHWLRVAVSIEKAAGWLPDWTLLELGRGEDLPEMVGASGTTVKKLGFYLGRHDETGSDVLSCRSKSGGSLQGSWPVRYPNFKEMRTMARPPNRV